MARGCKDTIKKYICMHSDFHCHTKYSDGIDTVEEMIVAAIDIGLHTIAITDHVRKDTKWFNEYVREIEKLKEKYSGRIKILLGFETKILNIVGGLDANDDWFGLTDIVLGSIHSIPSGSGFFSKENSEDKELLLSYWFKSLKGLIENRKVNVVAHPFSELKEYGMSIDKDMENQFICMVKNEDKVVEISLRHLVPDIELIRKLQYNNVQLCVGSDAHSAEELHLYHKQKKQYLMSFVEEGS